MRAQRRQRLRLALVIGALVLVPLGWLVVDEVRVASARRAARLTAGQKAELTALLDQREALARGRVERWNQALQSVAALTPGPKECPLTLQPPAPASAGAYRKYATHDSAFGAWSLCILRPAAAAPPCTRTWAIDPQLALLRSRLAEDDVYTWDLEQAKSAPPEVEPEAVVVVVGAETHPTVHSPAVGRVTFVPGTLAGRSFLYAPEQGRFVCGGEVTVRNSKNVDIEYSHFGQDSAAQQSTAEYETRLALERDLELHLRFAVTRSLRELPGP